MIPKMIRKKSVGADCQKTFLFLKYLEIVSNEFSQIFDLAENLLILSRILAMGSGNHKILP